MSPWQIVRRKYSKNSTATYRCSSTRRTGRGSRLSRHIPSVARSTGSHWHKSYHHHSPEMLVTSSSSLWSPRVYIVSQKSSPTNFFAIFSPVMNLCNWKLGLSWLLPKHKLWSIYLGLNICINCMTSTGQVNAPLTMPMLHKCWMTVRISDPVDSHLNACVTTRMTN